MRAKLFTVLAVMALAGAACGGDDGAAVRETGAASGSGSGSASASGSTAASGSGTASGAASDDCKIVDGTDEAATDEVHADLTEYKIALDKTTVPAGKIKFEAVNKGGEPHEIAIVKTENGAKLPTADDGSAEEGEGLIGEIEPFDGGKECAGTFELAAGTYAVICNIVEEGHAGMEEGHAHYEEGMFTTLTVS